MKPNLKYLLVSEDSNQIQLPNGESKIWIIQPIINFNVPFVPTQLSFSIVAAIDSLEINKTYSF